MAPEVLNGKYKTECDLWSLGVITYFMLSGTLPFPGRNDDEKEMNICAGRYDQCKSRHWKHVSESGCDFVRALLDRQPKTRLSGKRALQHSWIIDRSKHSETPLSQDVVVSLKRYADAHRFEKAIRHKMATHLTTKELHRLRNVFEKLDGEGTGTISIDDMKKVMAEDAADAKTRELLDSLDLSHFDLDGDGEVDWQEFVAGAMLEHDYYNEDNLAKVFAELDVNGDGKLCQGEIEKAFGQDHEFSRELLEKVAEHRNSVTVPGQLYLSLEEFKELFSKHAAPAPASRGNTEGKARRRHGHAAVSKQQYSDGSGADTDKV